MRQFVPLALLLALAPAAWSAGEKPEDVVAYREARMKGLSSEMKTIGMQVKGVISRPEDLQPQAAAMVEQSKNLVALFPEGTGPDKVKSESKAEIWTKAADFATAAKLLETETAALLEATKTGDLAKVGEAYKKVGEACGGCHEAFKVED